MKSLYEYISHICNNDENKSIEFENLLLSGHLTGFNNFLFSGIIIENSESIGIPQIPSSNLEHKAIIDETIVFLLKNKLFNNVLTYGYRLAKNFDVTTALHCESVNSNVQIINNSTWKILRNLIGNSNFVNILVNFTVILITDDTFMQVIGNRMNMKNKLPTKPIVSSDGEYLLNLLYSPINVKNYLHKNSWEFRYYNILPKVGHIDELRELIFSPTLMKISRLLKKNINEMLSQIVSNHKKSIKYLNILNNICPANTDPEIPHLERQINPKDVNRFLIVILEKLLPKDCLGSSKNKSYLFSKISKLINLPMYSNMSFIEIVEGLKTNDFKIFTSGKKLSLPEFNKLKLIIHQFTSWIFRFLVPNIISTFFYCTNVSSGIEIIFFRHDVWNKISMKFLDGYFSEYMIENSVCKNHESYTLSEYNHSKLRVIPKSAKDEFRTLAIPLKGMDSDELIAYKENNKNIIEPVKAILEYLRSCRKTHFNKLYSTSEISDYINLFERQLLKQFSFLPVLHVIKFDIKSCYDSLPRIKLIEVLQKLLECEKGFYVRSQSFYDLNKKILQTKFIVNGSRKPKDSEIYIDNVKTTFFSKEDLLEVVKTEIFKTSLVYGDKCYLRKDGLFQGSSLSALLVDLLYDDLLEYYPIFRQISGEHSIVLRLADDFLIITTSQSQFMELKCLCTNGFKEYGAILNSDKIVYNSTNSKKVNIISFCAVNICINSLNVWKHSKEFNVPLINLTSPKMIYRRLNSLFKMRLSYAITSPYPSRTKLVLMQLYHVSKNVSVIYKKAFEKKKIIKEDFGRFMESIIETTMNTFPELSDNQEFLNCVRTVIDVTFFRTLVPNRYRYKNALSYLKCRKLKHAKYIYES
ncbi:hypothetical protein Kpol_1062p49 [Vanderwaltozyma polyspora DSM 70294]|uniref:Telomerase reverse transcriptase n=1 Tax=Vanderwaltozyma polyspora (strain ATCC 22028 / DSM 70294 / BCRC 21397 / CBS 2163 / NBRC 10782 / NRRL Y-8283 / UCD 57-17) TaxID=436907 RepID=A7TKA4_VANPO|nr:uncharacterized protein Kpol_1062p49 [Vanderwaltozyma polyspora DSM 70294]EDO17339.1 hypothetical protein Kpol_1062p49 [Vanderwaltozyma polyspora DSM 70294]